MYTRKDYQMAYRAVRRFYKYFQVDTKRGMDYWNMQKACYPKHIWNAAVTSFVFKD